MTYIGNITPMKQKQHKHSVAVLINDGLGTFEFGIAVEVFGLPRPEFNFPWYEFTVVNTKVRPVKAAGGVTISASAGLEALRSCDTIIVPSWQSIESDENTQLIQTLLECAAKGARFLSICSGVFLLAQAGLLSGKKATTHWKHLDKFKQLYPEIELEEDALYVDQGNIICSAGSAAGLDACMHLVRKDFGSHIANQVARRLVSHPHRDGGQAQFIPSAIETKHNCTAISAAMQWAQLHLQQPITVTELAEQAHMSNRTFLRRFKDTVGSSPLKWLQQCRINKSQELLETTSYSMEMTAELSGYQSSESFRVAFKKITGISPAAYRKRFRRSRD